MFEESEEAPGVKGLGILPGKIVKIPDRNGTLKIPQIGWNSLQFPNKGRLYEGLTEGCYVYFVHSFYATDCEDCVIATTEYSAELTAAVADKNCCGVQFHPEKSGEVGMKILKAFCKM